MFKSTRRDWLTGLLAAVVALLPFRRSSATTQPNPAAEEQTPLLIEHHATVTNYAFDSQGRLLSITDIPQQL